MFGPTFSWRRACGECDRRMKADAAPIADDAGRSSRASSVNVAC